MIVRLSRCDRPDCADTRRRHSDAHNRYPEHFSSLNEAIASVRSAADTARADGQFAVEVTCLQTATQFGDRSCSSRLSELATIVEGPRVGLAARFATALHDRDGAELAAVSEEFKRMGDLVAAVDAAAHAALAYRRKDCVGRR
jgi:hypothetical protein